MAHNQPLERFVYGTPGQMRSLSGVRTMNELFDRVCKDARRYTTEHPSESNALYKRHVLHFLNHRCRGVHIDLTKLLKERIVCISGVYPDQVLDLRDASPRLVHPSHVTFPASPYTPSEEAACDLAMEATMANGEVCPLSRTPLENPVFTIHGQVYERAAIEAWFRHSRTDPLTGERLPTTALF